LLYEEIESECYNFDSEENRQKYFDDYYSDKKTGISEEQIKRFKEKIFRCSFIADNVGKTTKYGNEHSGFFRNLYHDIAMNIDREKDKKEFCVSDGVSPLEQIPEELKEHFLYYEISFFNAVTISGGLMINYYFKLNNESKKYLLKFKNDFYINELEDLTFYKNGKEKFYSCTHEQFNSIE